MEKNTLIAIILDTRFSRTTDNRYPLKLRITHNRIRKYYSLNKWYTKVESASIGFPPPPPKKQKRKGSDVQTPETKEAAKKESTKPSIPLSKKQLSYDKVWLTAKINDANKILAKEPNISINDFEERMFKNEGSHDAYEEMQAIADTLKAEGRIKYAISFESAITSLKKQTGRDHLPFSSVDVKFLKSYETKMIATGHTYTAIGFYARNLRVAYNRAILKKKIDQSYYPFGKATDSKYEVPTGKNVKKALRRDDIGKLMKFQLPPNSNMAKGRDYWIFSYLCNGLNIKDMATLKYENIKSNTITFVRSKTARSTRKNPKTIVVPYTDEIKAIIDQWGNKPKKLKTYIFPILKEGLTPEEVIVKVASVIDFINNNIKAVAKLAGVEKNITTYTARHSWATVLKRAGVSTEHISEGLGHSDIATTENYLDSFESDDLFKNAALLTDFKSEPEQNATKTQPKKKKNINK